MSLVFSDTTTKRGIIQELESECGFNDGDISGNATLLKKFTASINQARDDYDAIALTASGTWQLDDSNHTDYPILTTNLVDGQRDYPFTTDEDGNYILDVYRVFVLKSATDTVYTEISPIDAQSDTNTTGFTDGQNSEGVPYYYDKTANAIFLDPIPSYNCTNGLKLYINREASYFTYSDTTKRPGVPGGHHKYFYLKPAAEYARRHNLANQDRIMAEVLKMERETIPEYYHFREKDVRKVLTMKPINYL